MVKLECELKGDFDRILYDVESAVMNSGGIVNREEVSDANLDNNRCAVRAYSVGVNLTLVQSGSSIRLVAVHTDNSYTGAALGVDTYGENLYLDAIRGAVEKYRADGREAAISTREDFVSKKNVEPVIIPTAEKPAKKEIKLSCGCLQKNKKELHKSTIKYCSDVLCRPLSDELSRPMSNTKVGRRTRQKTIALTSIARKLESIFKSKDYDYEMMVNGFYNIFMGIVSLVVLNIVINYLASRLEKYAHSLTRSEEYWFDLILFLGVGVFFVVKMFLGVLYIFKPTQKLFQRMDWSLDETRFKYSEPIAPVGLGIFDQNNKDIKKTNEMILYNNRAKFYLGGAVTVLEYVDMEGIFETENFFVVMIRNDCIYSFQKCDMRQEVEQQVREILSPYYKAVSE